METEIIPKARTWNSNQVRERLCLNPQLEQRGAHRGLGTQIPLNVWLLLWLLLFLLAAHESSLVLECLKCVLILLTSEKTFHKLSLTSLLACASVYSVISFPGNVLTLNSLTVILFFPCVVLKLGLE